MSIGYFLTYKGWFDDKSTQLFSRLAVNIAIPAYMIGNITSTYDKNELIQMMNGLPIPLAAIFLTYFSGVLIGKIIKVRPNRLGTFAAMFSMPNTMFVGLPVSLALFGEKSIPPLLICYIANMIAFWTIGVQGISSDGSKEKPSLRKSLKNIVSPPMVSFVFAVILVIGGIKLPDFIINTCNYLGSLTTPLPMFFIGAAIYSAGLKNIRFDKDALWITFGKFIAAPAFVILLSKIFPVSSFMLKVFIILASMPVMTLNSIMAKEYGADWDYASINVMISTILSFITIPLYMTIIN